MYDKSDVNKNVTVPSQFVISQVVKFVVFVGLLIVILKYHILQSTILLHNKQKRKRKKKKKKEKAHSMQNISYLMLVWESFFFIGLLDLKIRISAAHPEYLINYKLLNK